MGTKNWRETELTVFSGPALPTPLTAKNCGFLLSMQPLEEFLKTSVGQDGFHRIERVAKLIVAPGLMDEVLAGMARGHDLGSPFAARHHVMSPRRDLPFTEDAGLGHKFVRGSITDRF
jgi:hypothetical protein